MNLFYIFISSLFYILSFPTLNCWWLSFVALVPFFYALDREASFYKRLTYGVSWSLLISVGLGYWLFPTLCNSYGVTIPRAILFFGLCVFLPVCMLILGFLFLHWFMQKKHILFYIFIVPSIWTLMEYMKEAIPLMIPWGEIGYALVPFDSFIQIADIIGIYGVTFIVVMINSLIHYIIRLFSEEPMIFSLFIRGKIERADKCRGRIILPIFMIIFSFAIPLIYGQIRLASLHDDIESAFLKHLSINAQLIQGNFSLLDSWSGMGFYSRLQKYFAMTESAGEQTEGKRIVVWPETTLNSTTKVDDNLFQQVMRHIGENTLLISGGLKEDKSSGNVLNSAYLISGQGSLMRYDKHILLPYAETFSSIDWLGRYYTAPSQFQPGRTPLSFQTSNGDVGISICFEILYPKLIRRSVKLGAEFLVNISNDAWFGRSTMPYTHLNASRLRAIENRRFLLRTSNSGISAIIAPDGNITSQSHLFTCEQVSGKFLKLNKITFYTRFGDVVLYLSMLFLAIGLSRLIVSN